MVIDLLQNDVGEHTGGRRDKNKIDLELIIKAEVCKVKTILLITWPYHLPFSLSSHEWTVEFSRVWVACDGTTDEIKKQIWEFSCLLSQTSKKFENYKTVTLFLPIFVGINVVYI